MATKIIQYRIAKDEGGFPGKPLPWNEELYCREEPLDVLVKLCLTHGIAGYNDTDVKLYSQGMGFGPDVGLYIKPIETESKGIICVDTVESLEFGLYKLAEPRELRDVTAAFGSHPDILRELLSRL